MAGLPSKESCITWVKQISRNLYTHAVTSTAILAATHPIYQSMEVLTQMSDDVSLQSRLNITLFTYGGVGFLYDKFRNLSQYVFRIPQGEEGEKAKSVHDTIYAAAFSIPLSLTVFYFTDETSMAKIVTATGIGAGISAGIGAYIGNAMDVAKDLAGVAKCNRKLYPEIVANANPWIKKATGLGLVGVSVGIMAGIYALTPDTFDTDEIESLNSAPLEQLVDEL